MSKLRELWMRHTRDEAWFSESATVNPIDVEKRIIKLFGSPPYRFLKFGDPVPEKLFTRKRRTVLDPKYVHKFQTPGYSKLGKNPQFIDKRTVTEWWRASGEVVTGLKVAGDLPYEGPKPIVIQRDTVTEMGRQVFFVRLPIDSKREGNTFPEVGDALTLVHMDSLVECNATVIRVHVVDGRSTGWILVRDFTCSGRRDEDDD